MIVVASHNGDVGIRAAIEVLRAGGSAEIGRAHV